MAWRKTKRVFAVLGSVLAVAGLAILIVHYLNRYQGPSHFPKSAWTSAGFGDPVSALETACWATAHGDGKTMLASITPELQVPLKKAWEKNGQAKGMSLEDFFATRSQEIMGMVVGFRVLGEQKVNDHQARVHVYIQGFWHKATFIMKKTGGDWQVAGIEWR